MNVTRAGSEATRVSIELSQTVQALVRVTEPTPAIPASEMAAVLRYLAAAEYGLAQAFEKPAVCTRRPADDSLFWAAESEAEPAQAAKGLRMAARRLSRAVECSTDVATLLVDARVDIAFEGRAVRRRLLRRRSIRFATQDDSPQAPDAAPVGPVSAVPPARLPKTGRATRRVKNPAGPIRSISRPSNRPSGSPRLRQPSCWKSLGTRWPRRGCTATSGHGATECRGRSSTDARTLRRCVITAPRGSKESSVRHDQPHRNTPHDHSRQGPEHDHHLHRRSGFGDA